MMILLGWIIALLGLLKVAASLLRRGQGRRGGVGVIPEVEGIAEKGMSNNAPQLKYDVFVSFRGEDIRQNFLSHLVKAFSQKQINAFVDDKLKTGDEIAPSLLKAIEGSSISLIIFSEDYASSHWCLDELVKIIECKEKYEQIVIPVFYGVDPTDVRHQKKSYESGFAELEKRFSCSEVQNWRHVLNISASLSGITSSFRNDAELLEEIITCVLERLSKHPVNSKRLIGIDKPIAHLKSLLQKESKKVRVIGIWGMGGIGKTTIAEEIFSQNRSKYDGCCFLAKVSEKLTRHGGIEYLKEKLFSELLKEYVKELSSDIERRIGRMKVLIVLDDVKDKFQLETLFGTLDWFRSDSRIILTARDKQVLIVNEVDDVDLYEVRELDSTIALKLFNLYAFKQSHLETEYYELSKRVVEYAKGIPLVLKVLARMLRGKNKKVWESQLDKLKRLPIQEVYDVMRLSYDDLDRIEKKYFLDIACFFNGLSLKVDYMKLLLKDCESDNSVVAVFESLKDKALITISEDNVISMHDILQEMGQEVVLREFNEDPRKCSHLCDHDIIYNVLKNDKGTGHDAIRSICVDMSKNRKLKLSPHVFDKMTNLQFLDFRGVYDEEDYLDLLPQGLQSFPTDLRYLHWESYPLKSLPEKFSAENLVILNLFDSQLEKLWCGLQNLVNLKEVTLSYSIFLKELPDFSKATNLKLLNISGCHELRSVHQSIFTLDKLVHLDLSYCRSLTTFTSNSNLSSLQHLNLGGCKKLSKFSVNLENIVELNLSCCPINALPSSYIGYQSKLETLNLSGTGIEIIPSSIKNLTRLRKLDIHGCSYLQALSELPSSIETLLLSHSKIEIIPSSIKNLTRLRELDMRLCSKLRTLPELPSSVETLILSFTKIEIIPSSIKNLSRLRELNIERCSKLRTLPELPSSVETLILRGTKIESIPSSIINLTRLRKLDIRFCSKILSLPVLPSSLKILLVQDVPLKSVLFPSTVAEQFKENKKWIEFVGCLSLDERSLINIGLNLQINLMKFAHQHLSTLEHDNHVESYVDYKENFVSYQAVYVYPGSSVPEWFEYKTTKDEMIVDLSPTSLSPLLGFVFCFILAQDSYRYYRTELNITTIDVEGDGEKDGVDIYLHWTSYRSRIESYHVCMIYDQPCSQYLTRIAKTQTRFKIKVTTRAKDDFGREIPEVLKIKGFGISPIDHSTYPNLIQQME